MIGFFGRVSHWLLSLGGSMLIAAIAHAAGIGPVWTSIVAGAALGLLLAIQIAGGGTDE